MGRPILTTSYNKDGSVAQNISNHYSGDHQSVETTIGTGDTAITTTTYSDTRGLPLTIQHADGKCKQFGYDPNGNLTLAIDEEGIGSVYTYDVLNHLASQTIYPDGTSIQYSYDPLGNLLTRSLPEQITEKNSYNMAGQKTSSSLMGSDGATTRNYSYGYTSGLLTSVQDPRGFTTSIDYDDWMRPTKIISSGSSTPEQNQTTTYTHDSQGLLTSVAQQYNDSSTGPSTLVSRSYDAYGQLTSETTSLNGSSLSSWTQTWDAAGRRTALSWNLDQQSAAAQYAFSYNSLGEMISSQNASGTYSYTYANNGLLSQRITPTGTTSLTRDNRGRITDINNIINERIALAEHLDWTVGNRIQSYNVLENASGISQESRCYDYAGTKLFHEPCIMLGSPMSTFLSNGTLTSTTLFDETNFLQFNSGKVDRLGVRTSQDNGITANCVAAQNSFSQVIQANTYLFGNAYCWQLNYDGVGNLLSAIIPYQPSQNTISQQLTWDSFNRLIAIDQQSIALEQTYATRWGESFAWKIIYDGLGRRIQTSRGGNIINYYYDPEVEFLELGHNINGSCTWNLYGPDRSGFYGGVQGIGGLESSCNQDNETTKYWFNNYFGDAIGWYDSTNQSFSAYRLTLGAYGPMLGSPIPRVSDPQWRGHYIDETGFYYMGTRYYDPINGRFLSPDPLGHSSSVGLYDYCNGDPVNGLDPDGRCVKKTEAAASYLGNKYVNYSINEISDPISISRKAIERLGSKLDGVYAILKS